MKRYLHVFGLISAVILGFSLVFSCDDDEQISDPTPIGDIRVEVVSPSPNSTINSGQDISLAINLQQDADILNYKVIITNQGTGELAWFHEEFTRAERIELDTLIDLFSNTQSIMEIEVSAEDSFGNQIDEVVSTFTLNPPEGNSLTFNFDLNYNNELFLIDREYEYPSGEKFIFTRFDVYISEVTLIKGNEETTIADIDYLKMTNTFINEETAEEGFDFTIAGLEDGDFDSVRFNIGLTPEQNSTTPSQYPTSHPLGITSDYWGGAGWDSYIFVSLEGRMDVDSSNPDYEQGLALHFGSNDAMRVVNLENSISLANDQEEIIPVNIDMRDLFVNQDGEIYDILATSSTHDLVHLPSIMELADNLKNSINK